MGSSFKDLTVWQKSMLLTKNVYAKCTLLPRTEVYSLTNQIQRSAVSIPSNIAEGSKRGTRKDFRQFISVVKGSAAELEMQLILARDLYELDTKEEIKLLTEVQKMLEKLYLSLN